MALHQIFYKDYPFNIEGHEPEIISLGIWEGEGDPKQLQKEFYSMLDYLQWVATVAEIPSITGYSSSEHAGLFKYWLMYYKRWVQVEINSVLIRE